MSHWDDATLNPPTNPMDMRFVTPEQVLQNEAQMRLGVDKSVEAFDSVLSFSNQALSAIQEVTNYIPHNAPTLWKE